MRPWVAIVAAAGRLLLAHAQAELVPAGAMTLGYRASFRMRFVRAMTAIAHMAEKTAALANDAISFTSNARRTPDGRAATLCRIYFTSASRTSSRVAITLNTPRLIRANADPAISMLLAFVIGAGAIAFRAVPGAGERPKAPRM